MDLNALFEWYITVGDWCLDVKVSQAIRFNLDHCDSIGNQIA